MTNTHPRERTFSSDRTVDIAKWPLLFTGKKGRWQFHGRKPSGRVNNRWLVLQRPLCKLQKVLLHHFILHIVVNGLQMKSAGGQMKLLVSLQIFYACQVSFVIAVKYKAMVRSMNQKRQQVERQVVAQQHQPSPLTVEFFTLATTFCKGGSKLFSDVLTPEIAIDQLVCIPDTGIKPLFFECGADLKLAEDSGKKLLCPRSVFRPGWSKDLQTSKRRIVLRGESIELLCSRDIQ
jgi:hypothetical protein